MNGRQEFKTRIVIEGKTYLLAEDCAHALEYGSQDEFVDDHRALIKEIPTLPPLLLEEDYNTLLMANKEAFARQWHIEVTRVDSMRIHTESQAAIYPLKYMVAKDLFEYKARENGCLTVEEYIEKYDLPEEQMKCLRDLVESRKLTEDYEKDRQNLSEFVAEYAEALKTNGLEVQVYTEISESRIALNPFFAGENVFHEIYLEDYEFEGFFVNQDGEFCVEEYDYHHGKTVSLNKGKSQKERDFREHTALENISWILRNQRIRDAGVDLLECNDPGTYIHISCGEAFRLLNPNMSRDTILFDGIVEVDEEVRITDFSEEGIIAG